MAAITKRLLSDQVRFFLKGGYPDVAMATQDEDVYKRIEQVLNAMYKTQQFSQTLPSGETIPDNLILATYEDVAVTSVSNYSKATLPVMPISLPRNIGVNEIRPILSKRGEDRIYGSPMIPLQAGQNYLLQADSLLSDLLGQFGYEINGRTAIFTKDITTLGVSTVQMKLVVFSIDQYSETDILPVPSDAEDAIVKEVISFFVPVQPQPGIVSNYPEQKIKAQ
jgi:hypothetical protein